MKIAFFDSGVGGITVFKEALRLFPNEDFIYFSDAENAPYGSRSESDVKRLIIDSIDFLAEKNIDFLVLACHTASKILSSKLREKYSFPIINMQSGIKKSFFLNTNIKLVICGTDLSTPIWKNQLNHTPLNASYLSLQKLVGFAERYDFSSLEVFDYLERSLSLVDWQNHQGIVLGCTHFPFFKTQIESIIPKHIQILDGGLSTALCLKAFIPKQDDVNQNIIEYFISKTVANNYEILKYLKALEINHALIW